MKPLTIEIKLVSPNVTVPKTLSVGDWVDLQAACDIKLKKGESCLIPLGVCMKLPNGYEAIIAPRSSTFKKYRIIQTNSVGVIDETYCGDDDEWKLPVLATDDTVIEKGTRICQFRLFKHMEAVQFVQVDHMCTKSRGGFGSTGDK